MDDFLPGARAAIIANAVLAAEIGIIDGCRRLSSLGHAVVPDWSIDQDFLVFGALNSETDHLPIGEPRKYWDTAALAEKDLEIRRVEEKWREEVFAACRSVVRRFGVT